MAADSQQFTVHGDYVECGDVVYCQAVFQAVYATGIFSHVAADRAGDLRGGVGCVVQAKTGNSLGNRQVAHTGLHARQAVAGIDLQDFGEPGQAE